MKMLHTAYRAWDLKRSMDFYGRVGFREIGRIAFEDGSTLVMLNPSRRWRGGDAGASAQSHARFGRDRERFQPHRGAGGQARCDAG
jgi:hypothetical protein